ncbi:AGAP005258-PA-like protein [Anopheles sinensis]|uniref:AGAP005258-PA-like protein n=1 Tax=Anopheles sinensis TaxID=74873 RepID=A0A084VUE5_ANOSI|nr:AGAP005258-PA-like protein [Anopheles sinensis]
MKTGSVDLPDEIEKSLSSASTSPCPSPVRQSQKSHRLLPTNLYVVLYNFKSRHQDELDLKAGYKVTVIDTSDPDWWKGKCLGKVGYFPSKYCTKLAASEKPLQVTHNLQVTDNERGDGTLTLLRDQIVIQVGEELNGMVMVRSADNRQGVCPVKYLQERGSGGGGGGRGTDRDHKDQCHPGDGHHYHRESRNNNYHKSYDRSWEKWEKFREKKMEMMKAHKYNVEHRLKYDNQERILYRHHFNYYPVKRPRPRKTSLDPNWYTENIYSNQSIDNSDGELGVGSGAGLRDINGNMSMAGGGLAEDDGIFTIDGQFERRNRYPKSSSCCFGAGNRMRDIDEAGDGLELGVGGWNERYPKIPKSYSFSTSRSMGAGFNMSKLYNRNSFEMPEFPGGRDRRHRSGALSDSEGGRAIVRMCDREGCFNETCFTKDEKNFFNNHSHNHNHHHNHINNNAMNNSNTINNNVSSHHSNCNIISEWNLRNRNNLRARTHPESVAEGGGPRPQYVMEEDFDLFDEDDDEDEAESELTTLYADDRHSIAYGDYGGVARQLYGHPSTIGGHVDELYQAERSKQLLRSKLDRVTKYTDEFTDDYRKSFEDFFNQNCCIERHHRQLKDSGRFFQKPPVAAKNKSMLEVKPPNRFDDSSSGSTDLELDDFNFDFEKYWEELEKPSPTSPSELEERTRGTRGEVAGATGTGGKKVKNVNLNRCYNNGTVIDIYHDDDPYHRDHYHYREGGGGGGGGAKVPNNHHHRHNHHTTYQQHANTTPRSRGSSRHKVFPTEGLFDSPRSLCDEPPEEGGRPRGSAKPSAPDKPSLDGAGNGIAGNSNAISFLNNIFSIYKPNKYSPLNCHGEQNYLKNIPAKKMNIVASSSARPLGAGSSQAGAGVDTSSTKRPLTVHPTGKSSIAAVANAAARRSARSGPQPASTKDPQARFQIIPDKTGVKISPLYRLDAQDYRRARYKLKSTSRPLSFW